MILSPLRYSAAAGNFHVSTYLLRQNHDTAILLKDQARRLYLKILIKFLFFIYFLGSPEFILEYTAVGGVRNLGAQKREQKERALSQ